MGRWEEGRLRLVTQAELPLIATGDFHVSASPEFREYVMKNPHIYGEFCALSMRLLAAGRKHYGAKAIMEVIRYETAIRGGDDWKINNNFTADLARLLMHRKPEFVGFFETRGRS